jgi:hypothetical protein
MKKFTKTLTLLAGLAVAGLTLSAVAAEEKAITITGDACCAKCALHKSDKCETVVKVTTDGKETLYYLEGKKAKTFHKKICEGDTAKVTVTGSLEEKDGKQVIEATKIEEVKDTAKDAK